MLGLPWVAQQRRRLLRWYASANVNTNSQAVAFTLDGVTIAANQIAQHPQTAAFTLADVTVAASQTAQHPQSVAFSLADVAVSAVQTATHPQVVSFTLDDVVFAAQQGVSASVVNAPAGKSSRKKRHEYVDREPWLIRPTVRQPDAFDKVFESVLSVPPVRIRPGVPKQRQFDSQDDDESITHLLAMMF